MVQTVAAAIDRIRAFAKSQDLAAATFAKRAGLSPNALSDFHKDSWSPTLKTLQALEALIPDDFIATEVAA